MNILTEQQLERVLKDRGLRVSSHRLAILRFLYENKIHPTAYDIKHALDEQGYKLSLSSVYNILNRFVQKGIVSEIVVEEGVVRYDINTTPHAHFKCTNCGKVYDIEGDISLVLDEIARSDGHEAITGQIVIYGICRECLQKR